ncbi:gamma-glutamylcyclotransferase family protein [Halomonas dongshanensis]|uniref:Gamma-glutamylcyclotransferase n=1 Tax=Halomonas dongshanensis TaxID=2890835 RepID=A0ABT2EG77_9GAMM|nr:gamma-glutamylcyclotransferase family protein [Halomonas dongshanensis]MCS2610591.1 gamma-glutamylcyclotransferase [Halomonas dongshanensis]
MRTLKWLLLLCMAALAGVAAWLWLTMLSPWFYDSTENATTIAPGQHQVFVYGTLRFAPVRWVVMGSSGSPREASLRGFARTGLDLREQPGSVVPGLLLRVNPEQLRRLDRYERLGVRYTRHCYQLRGGGSAWVYRRLSEADNLTSILPTQADALVP